MSVADLASILGSAVAAAAPLAYAALGGLLTELTGMLNIALEGLILIGAFVSVTVAGSVFAAAVAAGAASGVAAGAASGAVAGAAGGAAEAYGTIQGLALAAGVASGMAASMAVAALFGIITIKGKANEFVTGLAANLLAAGLAVVISAQVFKSKGVLSFALPPLPTLAVKGLSDLPLAGKALFSHNILVYGSWLAAFLAWLLIAKTPFGLRLKASGSNPKALRAVGLSPELYRFVAVLISGAACGLSGACLSLSLSAYVPNISAGRGWIALVAIYLGGRKAWGVFAACLAFAAADSFANYAQGFLRIPSEFILALPYAVTLAALVGGAAWKKLAGRGQGK